MAWTRDGRRRMPLEARHRAGYRLGRLVTPWARHMAIAATVATIHAPRANRGSRLRHGLLPLTEQT